MVTITAWDDSESIIFVPFPKEKYVRILKGFGYTLDTNFSIVEYELIFLAAICEFKRGALSLDDLGAIGNMIFDSVDKKETLAWKAYAAEECIFYSRRSKALLGSLTGFLTEINEFYDEKKSKLDDAYKSCYVLKKSKNVTPHTPEARDQQ